MFLLVLIIIVVGVISLVIYLLTRIDPSINNSLIETFNQKHKLLTEVSNIKDPIDKIGYPVLYINLDQSAERRKFMEDQFHKYNIQYTRINAVYGKKYQLQGDQIDDQTSFVNTYNLPSALLGCTLSHLKAIKYAYDHNYDNVVVMEDDVSLNLMSLWDENLPTIVKRLPQDWKIFQLYHHCDYNNGPEFRSFQERNCYGAAAYLINREGMKIILQKCFRNGTFYIPGYPLGTADWFIYDCVGDAYIYHRSLFYTYNGIQTMESQLHPEDTPEHILTANRIIDLHNRKYKQYAIYIWKYRIAYNVFIDVAKLFQEYLIRNNYLCEIIDRIPPHNQYEKIIVLGANLCRDYDMYLPDNVIIVNMEQLYDQSPWINNKYLNLLKKYEVWDYNQHNIKWLEHNLQKNIKLFQLGYGKCLEQSNHEIEHDIDVLFYGALNDRRECLYNELKLKGLNVIFRDNLWDQEKEKLISRSKIILNVHYFPVTIFESVRVIPLLLNQKFVITENSSNMKEYDYLKPGLVVAEYNDLVSQVLYYLDHTEERHQIAQRGYQIIKSTPTILPL